MTTIVVMNGGIWSDTKITDIIGSRIVSDKVIEDVIAEGRYRAEFEALLKDNPFIKKKSEDSIEMIEGKKGFEMGGKGYALAGLINFLPYVYDMIKQGMSEDNIAKKLNETLALMLQDGIEKEKIISLFVYADNGFSTFYILDGEKIVKEMISLNEVAIIGSGGIKMSYIFSKINKKGLKEVLNPLSYLFNKKELELDGLNTPNKIIKYASRFDSFTNDIVKRIY